MDSLKHKNMELKNLTDQIQKREAEAQKIREAFERNVKQMKNQSAELQRLQEIEIGHRELEARYIQLKR